MYYEAPPATQAPEEMVRFNNWYNQTNPMNDDKMMSGLARAGIAHLWFETIHPFDDGNGRVGRAISDHALSQSLGYPTTVCLSAAIEEDKKFYYLQLEKASRSSLDASDWLNFIADRVTKAQAIAQEEVDFVLFKTRFDAIYGDQLNDRKAKMIWRVFSEGRQNFDGGITTKKYERSPGVPIEQRAATFQTWWPRKSLPRYQAVTEPLAMI